MLRRQIPLYLVIGMLQLGLDSALFIALTAAGLPVGSANVLSRALAALLGFALNGRYTFQSVERPWRLSRSLPRFIAIWCALTALGTMAVSAVDSHGSLRLAWAMKPMIDALLALASFLISRCWIYR